MSNDNKYSSLNIITDGKSYRKLTSANGRRNTLKINIIASITATCNEAIGCREFVSFDDAIRTLRKETGVNAFVLRFYDRDEEELDIWKDIPEIEICN